MIEAINLGQTVYVDNHPLIILANIHLHIRRGESLAIVGTSGSGKSTLLGLLAGLDVPTHGKILIERQDITELDEEARAEMRAQYVAFIFQNFQLLPSFTALDNVALPLEMKRQKNALEQAEYFLEQVGLSQRRHHFPHQLSGGEQQRVAIARAFACQAPILFADEPTGNLDNKTGRHISDLLFALNQRHQTTLVLVTHDSELANHCQSQIHLHDGTIVEALANSI